MKRDSYDVPRWYLYLHRRERGLPFADELDTKERRFEDELFGRLYAPDDVKALHEQPAPGSLVKALPPDVQWSQGMHRAIEEAVGGAKNFEQAVAMCRGSATKSATVAREMIAALPTEQQPGKGAGASTNQQASGSARGAQDGLSGVQFGSDPWSNEWKGETEENKRAKTLAEKIRDSAHLKRIAELAGKFKRIATTKQKAKVKHGVDEITDVVQGDDIARLLPMELARFASRGVRRLAAVRDLLERRCLQYEMTATEPLGRGPLVVCIDKSGSMEGDKDVWASAVALALLETVHREHRTFILLGFNEIVFSRIVVEPGRPFPERGLLVPCEGGTNISKVLDLALHAAESSRFMARADIVIVTDGGAITSEAPQIRARALAKSIRIIGIGIGVPPENLAPWCDEAHCVEKLDEVGDNLAGSLFGR